MHCVTGLNALRKCSVLGTFWTSGSQNNSTTLTSGSENVKCHIHPICAYIYVHLISPGNKRYITLLLCQAYKVRPAFAESTRLTEDTVYSTVYTCYGYARDFKLSSDSAAGTPMVFQTFSLDGTKRLTQTCDS